MKPDYSKIKLHLCTPCYGGNVTSEFSQSLNRLSTVLRMKGINHRIKQLPGDSLITRARTALLAVFLADADATHMMFIDADIKFTPQDVLRLIDSGHLVTGGIYPMKTINWEAVIAAVKENPDIEVPELQAKAAKYVINIRTGENDKEKRPMGQVRDDFVQVTNLGTGFLLIRREAFEHMISHYGDQLRYVCDLPQFFGKPEEHKMYRFFDTWAHPKTNRYLSEDYAFCQRYIEAGGSIWGCLKAKLGHRGSYMFEGDPKIYFNKFIQPLRNVPETKSN